MRVQYVLYRVSANNRVFARRPQPRDDLWAWSPTRLGSTEIEVCATRIRIRLRVVAGRGVFKVRLLDITGDANNDGLTREYQ